jgi:16S rRNA (guanine527-N7)-methyltransferase
MKHVGKIEAYKALLKDWNSRVNLYSEKAYDRLDFHIQDSIHLAEFIGNQDKTVLDMGSGSGLPSVIIAIMNPRNKVTAIESKAKKVRFLEAAREALELPNYEPIATDINEYLAKVKPTPHFITAKAFAPYDKLKKICRGVQLAKNPTLLVPLSLAQIEELEAARSPEGSKPKNRQFVLRGEYHYLHEKLVKP